MSDQINEKSNSKIKPKASTRLITVISVIIGISFAASILGINSLMKIYAREDAAEKAMIILDRNIATHTYFSHQLKPALFKVIKGKVDEKYFDPIWMSSTYAVREIDKYYQSLSKSDYYYKEAAINARSPENEADAFEREFIKRLNTSPELNEYSDVRTINGKPFLVVLRRGETMEQSCLRCHSTPDSAPTDMVIKYGPDRSFRRTLGEVVSAASIRIPLGETYRKINKSILLLSVLSGMILLVILILTIYFSKRWVFSPLDFMIGKFNEIIKNPEKLGEEVELPSTIELSELTQAFNKMSYDLRVERDKLESRVAERTDKLSNLNVQLKKEIESHKKTIDKLELTLKEVKTLSGLLPICAHCKNIRDDKGYWQRVESYIAQHSEAVFSHGICPDCVKKYYPDLVDEKDIP